MAGWWLVVLGCSGMMVDRLGNEREKEQRCRSSAIKTVCWMKAIVQSLTPLREHQDFESS